jgi:arylsulfatase A-like enzyme
MISSFATVIGVVIALLGQVEAKPNILLIIGDDMGVETLASYGIGAKPPMTRTLDQLAQEGIRFSRFWSQPVCSPTRATILTGRYGFRTGVGRALTSLPTDWEDPEKPDSAPYEPPRRRIFSRGMVEERRSYLPSNEFTLPMALKENGYATAIVGKWHLGDVPNGWLQHPNLAGFEHYYGPFEGTLPSYFAWNTVIDGEVSARVGYAPTDKTNDAISWINEQGDEPWFLWLAYNLPHPPLHLPPRDLLQSDYSHLDPHADPLEDPYPYFNAMIEAMDSEIGRLLDTLSPEVRDNTYIIFVGDNGSVMYSDKNRNNTPFPDGQGKGSVYEGGVHVPHIISGPDVARGGVSDSLINSTDLFSTVMEMAGLDSDDIVPADVITDSVNYFSTLSNPDESSSRKWVYADHFFGTPDGPDNADYAIRGDRYKLLKHEGEEGFFDLQKDPYETENLLLAEFSEQERREYDALKRQVLVLRSGN